MTMISKVRILCPHCEELIEQEILVPDPNFMAEKMKDSAVEFDDEIQCEHCDNEINIWGSNSYYELYLASEDVSEKDFYYSQPEYDFGEYETDETIEESGIQGVLSERGIKSLYHFTKIENLEAISKQGIIPRAQLKEGDYEYTDINRSDGFLDANCISISFPQYRMFFIKRIKNPLQNWVVFEISPELLSACEAAFFERNAASRIVQSEVIENRKTATAFENMFSNIDNLPKREESKIPDCYPTDPQAEVLVFDKVDKSFIVAAHFPSEDVADHYAHSLNGIPAKVTPELFENRMDHDLL
ncbi:hypothetical protein CTM97_03750 [Photobacterium phosphoreum]|uniref:DarT domain-containing protein n=1 Tax=Photobacterium phosphoreum TaxID=659 RepID=A0A2T3JWU4_PHOPO|nr:DarT ssDNA thymidine ADP-ribosyltransferase family protein [Photobacterium phosphoreum]PSU25664.1 hypothetical protein CTM96_08100 [Photobacterium phosphoreum]PSU43480.1 hypothetical protein CTM97_03750 [Photobacterium phosphoreum]PSU53787.1 hypothetical protein C9J18_05125 [Photobacterium phosphoreum]